jgi:hypothetical protein
MSRNVFMAEWQIVSQNHFADLSVQDRFQIKRAGAVLPTVSRVLLAA